MQIVDDQYQAAWNAGEFEVVAGNPSTVLRRMPQSGIEVETRNAGGCGIDWRVEHTPVEKYARLRNTNRRGKQPRILRSEQIAEQVKRFSRNKFAANFMTWKTSALNQQHGGAAAGRGNGWQKFPPGLR